jgi:hypothetical protein
MGTFVCFWDEIKEGKGTIFIGKKFYCSGRTDFIRTLFSFHTYNFS